MYANQFKYVYQIKSCLTWRRTSPRSRRRRPVQLERYLRWLGWTLRRARRAVVAAAKVAKADTQTVRVDGRHAPAAQHALVLARRGARGACAAAVRHDADGGPRGGAARARRPAAALSRAHRAHRGRRARAARHERGARAAGNHLPAAGPQVHAHARQGDLALYFLSHGASRAAVEMHATAAGGVHYNSASSALTEAAKQQQAKIKKESKMELAERKVWYNYKDNYFSAAGAPLRCCGAAGARRGADARRAQRIAATACRERMTRTRTLTAPPGASGCCWGSTTRTSRPAAPPTM